MNLSIVTTLYKSEKYINEFYNRITTEAEKITDKYEIIFVNDGSPDQSLDKVLSIYKKQENIKVIDLSKNFGHHKAIMTGLAYAKGDYVFLLDSDLEEEPELLSFFWDEMQKEDALDVVYGVQEKRKGKWFERLSGNLFYKLFNFFSDIQIPKNFLTIRLMKKNYVSNIVRFQEKEIVFSVLTVLTGFKTKEIKIKKLEHSPTTYSFTMKVKLLFNIVISSTARPLWMVFNTGLLITSISLFYILYLLYMKVFYDSAVGGWTSIMVLIAFFGGLIIFFLGIIGIYLAKIFSEVKNRPLTIVKKIYDGETVK